MRVIQSIENAGSSLNERAKRTLTIGSIGSVTLGIFIIAAALLFPQKILVPERVSVANLKSFEAGITWTTSEKLTTELFWGTDESATRQAQDTRDTNGVTPRYTHFSTLKDLDPGKVYYYRIKIGSYYYPALSEKPYSFQTPLLKTESVSQQVSVYGTVATQNLADTIIKATVETSSGDTVPIVTLPDKDGNWIVNIAEATVKTGDKTPTITEKNQVTIVVDSGIEASIQKTTAEASPVALSVQKGLNLNLQSAVSGVSEVKQQFSGATISPTPTASTDSSKQNVFLRVKPTESSAPVSFNLYGVPSITNITSSSASTFWISAQKESTNLTYAVATASTTQQLFDDRDTSSSQARYIHHVTFKQLSPVTTYTFSTSRNKDTYFLRIPKVLSEQTKLQVISGKITNPSECIVLASFSRSNAKSGTISTLPNRDGTFSFNVGPVRTESNDSFFLPEATDTLKLTALCIPSDKVLQSITVTTTLDDALNKDQSLTVK